MATLASSGDAPQTSLSAQVEPTLPGGSPRRERPRQRKCGPRWPTWTFQRARHPHPDGGRLNAAPVTVPAQPAGPSSASATVLLFSHERILAPGVDSRALVSSSLQVTSYRRHGGDDNP